jgi:hypothetical protein
MKFTTPYPIVCVEWVDSCEPEDNAEIALHEIPEPQRIFQVGMLVKSEKEYVSVAGAWKPEDKTLDYVITIPTVAIVTITTIEE